MLLEVHIYLLSVSLSVSSPLWRIVAHKCQSRRVSCDKGARQNTYLWKVMTEPPSFVFGTLHVPYEVLWADVSEAAKIAFSSSDKVFFEMIFDNETCQYLHSAECHYLPKEQNLTSILGTEFMDRIHSHFDWLKSEIPSWIPESQKNKTNSEAYFKAVSADWQRRKPIWLRQSSQ